MKCLSSNRNKEKMSEPRQMSKLCKEKHHLIGDIKDALLNLLIDLPSCVNECLHPITKDSQAPPVPRAAHVMQASPLHSWNRLHMRAMDHADVHACRQHEQHRGKPSPLQHCVRSLQRSPGKPDHAPWQIALPPLLSQHGDAARKHDTIESCPQHRSENPCLHQNLSFTGRSGHTCLGMPAMLK